MVLDILEYSTSKLVQCYVKFVLIQDGLMLSIFARKMDW